MTKNRIFFTSFCRPCTAGCLDGFSLMHVKKIRDFSLDDAILICSLPDMGQVGGLVARYLKKALNASEAAKITIHDKPWINQRNGLIDYPVDEYDISVNEELKIVVFSGHGQPQEYSTVRDLMDELFSTVQGFGKIKLVISSGGYLPTEREGGADVLGVATNERLLGMLESHSVGPLNGASSITWFNGLVLGHAKERNIDGIGLFGRVEDPESPQYGAASGIVKKNSALA